jgi:hypothetical protein
MPASTVERITETAPSSIKNPPTWIKNILSRFNQTSVLHVDILAFGNNIKRSEYHDIYHLELVTQEPDGKYHFEPIDQFLFHEGAKWFKTEIAKPKNETTLTSGQTDLISDLLTRMKIEVCKSLQRNDLPSKPLPEEFSAYRNGEIKSFVTLDFLPPKPVV